MLWSTPFILYAANFCGGRSTHRCKKTFFTSFIQSTFFTFFSVFYHSNVFIFKKVHWKYHLKSLSKQRKQIGSVWLFFFVPMLELPYRPMYWQALLVTYRIGLHQVTPPGVVFLFMLVIGGLKNINVFYSTFTNVFLFLSRFLTFFIFFLGRFLHLWFNLRVALVALASDISVSSVVDCEKGSVAHIFLVRLIDGCNIHLSTVAGDGFLLFIAMYTVAYLTGGHWAMPPPPRARPYFF